jgi:hypothetical protein
MKRGNRKIVTGAIAAATAAMAFFKTRRAYRWFVRTIAKRRKQIEEEKNPIKWL